MAKRRVERTRNLGTQTEAAYWGGIRSALRSHFRFWKPMREAKRRAWVGRGLYKCAACGGTFPSKDVQIDHIIPCGSLKCLDDLAGFVERMTPEDPAAFAILCKSCHQKKTNEERKKR